MSRTVEDRRAAFRALHDRGCFVMPNPWDRGTARYFAHLGFPALATTSAGFAFGRGLPDAAGAVTLEDALAHIRTIAEAAGLPVNADFEAGYADTPEGVAESVRLCAATGVAGLSIEDATGRRDAPLYDVETAVARIRAAKASIAAHAPEVMLTGRAECFLTGHPDPLRESIRRLTAYAEAGADVLYAPGLSTPDEIAAVVKAAAPKPVNLLVSRAFGLTVADIAALGVRRISLGSALARVAWGQVMRTAGEIAREGRFDGLSGAVPFGDINAFFTADQGMAKPADA